MQIYLVGGAVRDALLGIPVQDKDYVVVGATHEQMLAQKFIQVGAQFPVYLHPKTKQEYALARKEVKSGHGYTGFNVEFGADVTLEEDLKRRDLTINAMALSKDKKLIDPFNGAIHLQQKVLKHVSSSFVEDPLRVLRLARFAAKFYDFSIDDDTIALCKQIANTGELAYLTKERVLLELHKAMQHEHFNRFFAVLREVNAIKIVLPVFDFKIDKAMQTKINALTNLNHKLALLCSFSDSKLLDDFLQLPLTKSQHQLIKLLHVVKPIMISGQYNISNVTTVLKLTKGFNTNVLLTDVLTCLKSYSLVNVQFWRSLNVQLLGLKPSASAIASKSVVTYMQSQREQIIAKALDSLS